MAVQLSLRLKKLLVTAGSGHRFVLECHFRHADILVLRITYPDFPAGLFRRRSQRVNTASRRRNQRRTDSILTKDLHHAVDGVTLADPARIQLDTLVREADSPVQYVEQDPLVSNL